MKRLLATKKRKLLAVLLVLFLVAAPVVWLAGKWASAPASGSAQVAASPGAATPRPPEYQPVKTAYFSTQVPKGWRIENRGKGARIQLVAFAPSGDAGQAAIVSDVLPSDGLAGVSDYNLRTTSPAAYAPFASPALPAGAKAFKRISDTPEYILFTTKGQRYASVAVSGQTTPDELTTLFNKMASEWVWL